MAAAALLFLRHSLALHRVNAGEAAYAGLIKLYSSAGAGCIIIQRPQFCSLRLKRRHLFRDERIIIGVIGITHGG